MRRSDHPGAGLPRREFLAVGLGAFVVATVPLAARRRAPIVRRSVPVMGTIAEVSVVHRNAALANGAIDAALGELWAVERLMSRFDPASDIGRANTAAGRGPVRVDVATAAVVRAALEWAQASNGRFDPALGVVSEVWDVTNRHEPPPASAWRRLADRGLYRGVDVSRWRGEPAVVLAGPDAHLDLGGIAKGHAVDRAAAALRDWGVRDGIVTVGGDLYALGHRPDGSAWRVGVRSPAEPSRLIGTLEATDEALATSGDYERFFRHRGVAYHHLMDPATAAPRRTTMHSVTVKASCCRDADAAATAVFGLDREAAGQLLAKQKSGAVLVTNG